MEGLPDPGVPEGLPTTLRLVRRRLGAHSMDRLWIFPAITRGRRERGLVAVSCFAEADSRRLYTAAYLARRSGLTLGVEPDLVEQGLAPSDCLPRVMAGVARRGALRLGDPEEVVVAGDASALDRLISELEERIRVQGL